MKFFKLTYLIFIVMWMTLVQLPQGVQAASWGLIPIQATLLPPAFHGEITIDHDKIADWWIVTPAVGSSVSLSIQDVGLSSSNALTIVYEVPATRNEILIGRDLVYSGYSTDLAVSYNTLTFYIEKDSVTTNLLVSIANPAYTSNNFVARVSDYIDMAVSSGDYYLVSIPFNEFRPAQLTGDIPDFVGLLKNAASLQFVIENAPGISTGMLTLDQIQFVNNPNVPPVAPYNPLNSFDMETYGAYWYSSISTTAKSDTLTTNVQNAGAGDTKALAIDYNISDNPENIVNWAIVGRSIWTDTTNISLAAYGSVSFYVKATPLELLNLNLALTNDKLTSVNYQVRVSDYVVSSPDAQGYVRVSVPFSKFVPMYISSGVYTAPLSDLISSVNAIQFRVGSLGSGEILVDNLVFNLDTVAPAIANFTPPSVTLTRDQVNGVAIIPTSLRKSSYQNVSNVELSVIAGGLKVRVAINDSGVVVMPKNITPNVWLQMNGYADKVYMSALTASVNNNILSGYIYFPADLPLGTGNVFINPAFLADLAGNHPAATQTLIANVIYAGELNPPRITSIKTSGDIVGRRVQRGDFFAVTIRVTDDTSISSTCLPVFAYTDNAGVTRSFDIVTRTTMNAQYAEWLAESQIAPAATVGTASISIAGIKDVYSNELVTNNIAFVITLGTPVNAILSSRIFINDKEIATGDYVAHDINNVKVGYKSDLEMTSYQIKLVHIDGTPVTTSAVLPIDVTGTITVGSATTYTSTANYNFMPAVQLSPGNYKLVVYAWDATMVTMSSTVLFSVTDELLTQLLSAPNPFNPRSVNVNDQQAHITYYLAEQADVELRIYSISGELLKSEKVAKGQFGGQAGYNELVWNGKNRWGEEVANGVYLGYLIVDTGSRKTKGKVKIAILK